ncbi:MAG: hypothetical protein ABI920_15820, partial [Casimicrobiaceae bacterium]
MSGFAYRDGELFAEDASLAAIAARFGTPCYVYSRAILEAAYREYDEALAGLSHSAGLAHSAGLSHLPLRPHLVCYA